MANEKKAPPRLLAPRDLRFLYDVMIGVKGISPNTPIENGKDGWRIWINETPGGKPDPGQVWVMHHEHGAMQGAIANTRYIRWWLAGDETRDNFPKALREAL